MGGGGMGGIPGAPGGTPGAPGAPGAPPGGGAIPGMAPPALGGFGVRPVFWPGGGGGIFGSPAFGIGSPPLLPRPASLQPASAATVTMAAIPNAVRLCNAVWIDNAVWLRCIATYMNIIHDPGVWV